MPNQICVDSRFAGVTASKERAMGFEPTTSALGRLHSATELRPQDYGLGGHRCSHYSRRKTFSRALGNDISTNRSLTEFAAVSFSAPGTPGGGLGGGELSLRHVVGRPRP